MALLWCGSSSASVKVVWFQEALVTLRAFERLLSCVGPLLLHQGSWSWKTLVTLCALEWLLCWADHLMGFQVTWCWEALITVCALEWLLYWVDPLMGVQVTWCWSSCHTLRTLTASLPCGSSHVPASGQLLRSSWHTLGIPFMFLSSCTLERMSYYNRSIWIAFLLCGSSHE